MNEKTNSPTILGKYTINSSIFKNKHSEVLLNSLKPVESHSPLVTLIPKYIPTQRKTPKFLIGKPKEPKFVPYEPYKGAVLPMIPRKKIISKETLEKHTKNNVDIFDLVTQISDVRVAELNKGKLEAIENDEPLISRKQWESEVKAFETDIKNLRETNAHLENQVKFQTQVNSELKTLLVAAVGEDLETRVQHLTEDKLQLARALLNSAHHLTSHQEQTEWLSGQCEVWRSKFLASSLMVEELARWKSALSNKVNELQEHVSHLIDERKEVRNNLLQCHNNLVNSNLYLANEVPSLRSTNILDLSVLNQDLSCTLKNSLIRGGTTFYKSLIDDKNLERRTPAETEALQCLNNPVVMVNKPDLLCNALVGAAMSVGGGQMFLQHPSFQATCCAHCKGEVEDI
ncbi:hypothetical protein FQR65_LT00076 [Abscondita terminalis]|nr:hypothetical protein FQR65_LT00076 [Abscondita terminalis]